MSPEQMLEKAKVTSLPRRDPKTVAARNASPALQKPAVIPLTRAEVEPFRTLTPDQCADQPPRGYTVKGLIAPRDVVLLIGHPGSGKSVLAPHIGYAVAQGQHVLGRRVRGAPVLYIAAEAPHTMRPRIAALREEYGDAPDFHLLDGNIDLYGSGAEACLESIIATARKVGAGLVVLDTFAAAFPGLRENESDDMGRAVHTFRRIADETGAAVVVTHHIPKDGTTPRGHGSLNGDVDVVLKIEGTEDSVRTVSLSKNRNGPSGNPGIVFRVASEVLGTDEDGDPITAPIAMEEDATKAAPKGHTLTTTQQGWHRDLCDLFGEMEPVRLVPASGCVEVETLTREQVREGLKRRGRFTLDPDGNLTGADREKLRSALNALKDCRKVGLTDKYVWLI